MYLPKTFNTLLSLCVWILHVLVVWVLIFLLISRGLRPKSPNYSITSFYVPALDAQNSTNQNHTLIITTFFFNLQISNPNKATPVYYNEINISLRYSNWVVGASSVPAFKQGHKKTTEREVSVNASAEKARLGKAFSSVAGLTGPVSLRVGLAAVVRYRVLWWKTKHQRMDLEALVPVGSDGKMLQGITNIKLNHSEIYRLPSLGL